MASRAGKELSILDELQTREVEVLVQGLEGDDGAKETLPPEAEGLLRDL